MKQNPFLSNENIFSKVPARKTTTVDTSAMASSPLQIGSSYQNTLSSFSNYGYSQQQYVSPMPSSRPNVSPNPPSFQSNGYSDSFGHKDPYVSSSVGSYQQTRQDNRTSIYDQIPQYTSAYSKVSEGSLGEPILSSRQRSITSNYPSYTQYQTTAPPERLSTAIHRPPEMKSPALEQTNDFPDLNVLTACLSNNPNMQEICKLIGINNPSPAAMTSPLQNITPTMQTYQHIPTNYSQNGQNVQQSRQDTMKLSSSSSQQEFKNQSRIEFQPEPQPQIVQSFKKQESWQQYSAPKRIATEAAQSPLKYQSDEEEEFDFNENREEQTSGQYHSPFSKKVSRVLSSKEDHMNRMYKIDAFIPEAGEIKSIKESLQKQIEQCTNRNGIKVFLTVSEQIQAKRYIPK